MISAPRAFSSLRMFISSSTASSSSAFVGSSSTMSSGFSIIAAAMPRRCFMPREYFLNFLLSFGSSPTLSSASQIALSSAMRLRSAMSFKFSKPVYVFRKLGFSIIKPRESGKSRSFPISLPSMITCPPSIFISPAIARMSIVLPEPFAPYRP